MAAGGPNILFRVDAALHIGTGHVMRCLTLAKELTARGAQCLFVSRAFDGHLNDLIKAQGFDVSLLPFASNTGLAHADWLGTDWQTDAEQTRAAIGNRYFDWLVVDHYAIDARWETAMRPHAARLMAIDDLADRMHDCDLLLDQNLGRKSRDYVPHVGKNSTLLLGPDYALLRPEFADWRAKSLRRRGESAGIKSLLVTMGGVDQQDVTSQILTVLKGCSLPDEIKLKVVMGPHSPWQAEVRALAERMPWPTEILVGVSNMGELMAKSDLAIGAAGSTSWERCCLGLPTLALVLADNQLEAAGFLEETGAIRLLGDARKANWQVRLRNILAVLDSEMLISLSRNSREVVDGKGAAKCAEAMKL